MEATERIMNYINGEAANDPALAEGMKNELKTPEKMMKYISGEAKKLCEEGASSVCVDDDRVFQWARHYWLDYEEKDEPKVEIPKYEPKSPAKLEPRKKEYEQINLFEAL